MTLRVLLIVDATEEEAAESPASPPADPAVRDALASLGYVVGFAHAHAWRLDRTVAEFRPDVIVIDSESDARDTLEHVVLATRDAPRPIALVGGEGEPERMREMLRKGVSAYVVAGLPPAQLRPVLEVAVARFEIEQQLRLELAASRAELEDRKILDRAKAVLMKKGMSEDEAHRRLRRIAMERQLKLVEAARRVIDASDLIG